jgi:hypothetical protein
MGGMQLDLSFPLSSFSSTWSTSVHTDHWTILGETMNRRNIVRSKTIIYVLLAGAALFASGIAVGQRAGTSKFNKYFRPAVHTEMDWLLLQVNVDSIRIGVEHSNGLGIPITHFDGKEHRLKARIMISDEQAHRPVETLREQISAAYYSTHSQLFVRMPGLSEDDFVLEVLKITKAEHTSAFWDEPFAECRHGDVVFHRPGAN